MNKFERILVGIALCLLVLCVAVFSIPYLFLSAEPVAAAPTVTLESRVNALETTQATLLKRVGILESGAVTKTAVLSATPVPVAAKPTLVVIPPPATEVASSIPFKIAPQFVGDLNFLSYIRDIENANILFSDGSKLLAARSLEAGADLSVMKKYSWQAGVTKAFNELAACNTLIRSLTPPSALTDAHNGLLDATGHLESAINLFTDGFANMDSSKLDTGKKEFVLAGKLMHFGVGRIISITSSQPLPTMEP